MKILITGTAGFIGNNLAKKLLENNSNLIIGIDNLNDYYDVDLKNSRLSLISDNDKYIHHHEDISNKIAVNEIFKKYEPEIVVNLAAQAGVRYSIDNPDEYIKSNIIGFQNILDSCKLIKPKHLVFASSSSVYGGNTKMPFSENLYDFLSWFYDPIKIHPLLRGCDTIRGFPFFFSYGSKYSLFTSEICKIVSPFSTY